MTSEEKANRIIDKINSKICEVENVHWTNNFKVYFESSYGEED